MRALGLAWIPLVLLVAGPVGAADLCDRLFVPDGYALLCETRVEGGRRTERATVRPGGGAAALAGLTLRRLDKAEEPLAWQVPELWLAERATVDLGGLASALRAASGAGPLAHPAARAVTEELVAALAGLGQLPHRACAPDHRPGRHQLRCGWGVAPLALRAVLRLAEAGGERYAVGWWALDGRRLRHLEAVANSLAPG